jgi:iron complex outermembrane receptor protein
MIASTKYYVFVFIILTIVVPKLSYAQTYGVNGKVTTMDGHPLDSIVVKIESLNRQTTSNVSGSYHMPVDGPGTYLLSVVVQDEKYERTVTLEHTKPVKGVDFKVIYLSNYTLNEVVISKYYRRYNLNNVSSALRIKTPLVELSQNIQQVGNELLFDQQSYNMTESVTRNVSGAYRQEASNQLGSNIFMRGASVVSMRNGMELAPLYRGPLPEDASIIERIEMVKGPSSFMGNVGDPAGSVNVVTKQPTGKTKNELQFMLGSYDFYRLSGDFDGTLGKKKKLLYRMNVMGMKSNSFADYDFHNRFLIAPVLEYRVSDRTSIKGEYIYQKLSYGVSSPLTISPDGFGSLPASFSIADPNMPAYQGSDHNAFLTLRHDFNDKWQWTNKASYLGNLSEGSYLWALTSDPANRHTLQRNPKYDYTNTNVMSVQSHLNGSFRTGPVNHKFVGGLDANWKNFTGLLYFEHTDKIYPLDLKNPTYGIEIDYYQRGGKSMDEIANTRQKTNYVSLHALDEFSLADNKLRVTVAGRLTRAVTDYIQVGSVTTSSDIVFTPRIGLSYSILPQTSLYGLFDNTFMPQGGFTRNNAAIKPLYGRNLEAGIKRDWGSGQWNSTLSIYNIHRRNIVGDDPLSPSFRANLGESKSKGIELDIKGEILNGLNVVFNYSYSDSKITNDPFMELYKENPELHKDMLARSLVGENTPNNVKHIQNTWLNYEKTIRDTGAWGISLGYQYLGGRIQRHGGKNKAPMDDFFRVDGGINWRKAPFKVNLMVNNLLNKSLYATAWDRGGLYFWAPNAGRNFRLSIAYSFAKLTKK